VTTTVANPLFPVLRLKPGNLRLTNLSTRARVTPENSLIAGFALKGETSRTVLVRVAGPALNGFGVADAVAAPRLRLHDSMGAVIAENAGWSTAPLATAAVAITGAFPFSAGSTDSAVIVTLTPGNYSAEVIAEGGTGGVALVEVYDVEGTAAGSRLSNVSTLGTVASAGGEVISGFVLAGTGTKQYLFRGVGPGLAKIGVTGTLIDPLLTVFDSTGRSLAINDDWNSASKPGAGIFYVISTPPVGQGTVVYAAAQTAVADSNTPIPAVWAAEATGAFALDSMSFDAALVTTLGAGAYTVQVTGNSLRVVTPLTPAPTPTNAVQAATASATRVSIELIPPSPGTALLEIYEVP
jgi:hypothetical protein